MSFLGTIGRSAVLSIVRRVLSEEIFDSASRASDIDVIANNKQRISSILASMDANRRISKYDKRQARVYLGDACQISARVYSATSDENLALVRAYEKASNYGNLMSEMDCRICRGEGGHRCMNCDYQGDSLGCVQMNDFDQTCPECEGMCFIVCEQCGNRPR